MARTFGGASTDKIAFAPSAAINNLVTQTYAVWTYRTGAGGSSTGRIFQKYESEPAGSVLYVSGANYVFEAYRWSGLEGRWSFTAPPANAWHHICLTYDAGSLSNTPIAYVDGVSVTVTTNQAPTGTLEAEADILAIGNDPGNVTNWAGRLAEFSVHNVVLNPTQVATLAAGFMAHTVLPANLALYAPLWGLHSPEIDISTNMATGTVTGTVLVAHPPGIQETAPVADVLTVVNQILTLVQNTATLAEVKAQILTTALTESYAADGVAPTLEQFLFMMWSALAEFGIAGTTITCKRLNGSTTSMTFTLDSSTNPTSRTRAT